MLSISRNVKEKAVENFEETYNGDEFFKMYGWIGVPDEDQDLCGKQNI